MTGPGRQRGVALLVVMIIVALATLIATQLAYDQHLGMARAGNQIFADQAQRYVLGGEAWAKIILGDEATDNDTDSQHDDWAIGLPPVEIAGGTAFGAITDLQGRFNINNLLIADAQADEEQLKIRRERQRGRLNLLFFNLEIPAELGDAIVDWQDADSNPTGFGGGEDDYYSRLSVPYLPANRLLVNRSELNLVRGMEAIHFAKLAPLVTALPETTQINLNTASVGVLRALGLDEIQAQRVLSERATEAFDTVDDFVERMALPEDVFDREGLDVKSQYFQLEVIVDLGDRTFRHYSLMHRPAAKRVDIIQRSQIPF